MIDITSFRTFPVAPAVSTLQATNSALSHSNNILRNILILALAVGGAYVIYQIIIKYNENESTTENKFPRN
jgi:hypothetical protein